MTTIPPRTGVDIPHVLYPHLIQLNETEVIVPIRINREDVRKLKAVKVSDQEDAKIRDLQDYLYERGILPDNTFASLFVYVFNVVFTAFKREADEIAAKEAQLR